MSSDPTHRAVVEAAYNRLRQSLAAKDLNAETLRAAALEALNKAKADIELNPMWVAQELDRLRAQPPGPDGTDS